MLLLICSNSLVQAQIKSKRDSASSTGSQSKADTTKVTVPIKFIKDANAKLIERNYLLKIKEEQQDIIKLNKSYINEQAAIIKDFQDRVVALNNDNNKLKTNLVRQKNKTKFLTGVSIVGILGTAAAIFLR